MKRSPWIVLLAVLALALLAGCGGAPVQSDPAPDSGTAEAAPAAGEPDQRAEPAPSGGETPNAQPEKAADPAPAPEAAPVLAPEPTQSPEPAQAPAAEPEPTPEPAAEPAPVPDAEPAPAPEDGLYTAAVTLEGGTGRASISSPAQLRCENGQFWATIVWSSSHFDYMKVDGEKYELLSAEGNSSFEIPVAAFDRKLDVIADTVAMSEPHEVAYTLYFDSATLQKQ